MTGKPWIRPQDGIPPVGELVLIYTSTKEVVLGHKNFIGGWTIYGLPIRQRMRVRFLYRLKMSKRRFDLGQKFEVLAWQAIYLPSILEALNK